MSIFDEVREKMKDVHLMVQTLIENVQGVDMNCHAKLIFFHPERDFGLYAKIKDADAHGFQFKGETTQEFLQQCYHKIDDLRPNRPVGETTWACCKEYEKKTFVCVVKWQLVQNLIKK